MFVKVQYSASSGFWTIGCSCYGSQVEGYVSMIRSFSSWLLGASAFYLVLPQLIFVGGWLQGPWAVGGMVCCLLGLVGVLRAADPALHQQIEQWRRTATWPALGLLVLGCLVLVAVSGVGGYGAQIRDWEKHEIVLEDLIRYDWPVVYRYHGVNAGLVYYIAYYLPAALVGKWLGVDAAHQCLALWTLAGLVLSVLWFAVIVQRKPLYGLVIFALFSGVSIANVVLAAIPGVVLHPEGATLGSRLGELHPGGMSVWQYRSNLVGLFWAPQHALSGWLFTALLLATFLYSERRDRVLWYWAATPLWSPFVTLGLMPLLAADLSDRRRFWLRLRSYWSVANGAGIGMLAFSLVYFASKLAPLAAALEGPFRVGTIFSEAGRWDHPAQLALAFVLFCLLEFGFYFAIDRFASYRNASHLRRLYWAVLGWLLLLPLFVFGQFNDLVLGASLPALFFVATIVGRNGYLLQGVTRRRALAWTAVLLLAAATPLLELTNQLTTIAERGSLRKAQIGQPRSLPEQYALRPELVRQYVSSLDTLFFTTLARQESQRAVQEAQGFDPLLFAGSIVLADVRVDPVDLQPGETAQVQLLFQAVAAVPQDYSLGMQLIDAQGSVLWQQHSWPVGMATSTWVPSRALRSDQRSLALPPDSAPGLYRLELYLVDPVTQEKINPQRVADGARVAAVVPAGVLAVGTDLRSLSNTPLAQPAYFGSDLALVAASHPAERAAGLAFTVDLVWQAQQRAQAEYTGFVHLLDAQGQLVAQNDHPIADNFVPPSLFRTGLLLADRYTLELPPTLVAGEYRVVAGVYNTQTLERLPVGQSDTYLLGTVTVP